MNRYDRDLLWMFFCAVMLIAGAMFGINALEARSCRLYGEQTGRPTAFQWFDACYVETPSGVHTRNEYQQIIIAREGLGAR